MEDPLDDISRRTIVRDWAIHVLTGLVIVLIVVMGYLSITVKGWKEDISALRDDVASVRQDIKESKIRGCITLAQNSAYLPPSCLHEDVLDLYARDLIDVLKTTGLQGENRKALCISLEDQGIEDTDCRRG